MILFNLNNLKELLESLSSLKYYCDNKDISYEDVIIELKDKKIEVNMPAKERGIVTYNNKTLTDMSPWDKEALKKLKKFREEIDGIIYCMEVGDTYNPCAININILLEARDCIAKARAVE